MKLGSKPDTFYTADAVRSVSSEVSSDLIILVKGNRYLLHKFPLLSKCLKLQRLCAESPESLQYQILQLPDFPGGVEAFELCAKFCYGITITVSAYNIIAVRRAADYLQMTEDVDKGNMIYKLDVFFNSCILHGWRDSIVTLQSTKAFPQWSEDLGITSRCIEAIASKVLTHPSKASLLSRSCSRRGQDDLSSKGTNSQSQRPASKGWWAEDIAELGIDLYWRTMIAIKSGGTVPCHLIGEALQIYASRWFHAKDVSCNSLSAISDIDSDRNPVDRAVKYRLLLESIVSLLPAQRGAVHCSFLLKLLKAANRLNASPSSKMELARRAGIQLEEAKVHDLLIPSRSQATEEATKYDVDIVMTMLEQFLSQGQSPPTSPQRAKGRRFERRRSRSAENIDLEFQESRRSSSASHGSKLKVAKVVDGYIQEIARDEKLPLSKMIALAEAIPDFARIDHDDLYKGIDIYLKAHPDISKSERKRLCRILDCRKLSMEACMHAAQNEKLPLRVIVQVLFFEQARAATAGGNKVVTDLPPHIKALLAAQDRDDSSQHQAPTLSKSATATAPTLSKGATTTNPAAADQWNISGPKNMKMKSEDEMDENDDVVIKASSRLKSLCALPTHPKRMFSKLLSMNRSVNERN